MHGVSKLPITFKRNQRQAARDTSRSVSSEVHDAVKELTFAPVWQ